MPAANCVGRQDAAKRRRRSPSPRARRSLDRRGPQCVEHLRRQIRFDDGDDLLHGGSGLRGTTFRCVKRTTTSVHGAFHAPGCMPAVHVRFTHLVTSCFIGVTEPGRPSAMPPSRANTLGSIESLTNCQEPSARQNLQPAPSTPPGEPQKPLFSSLPSAGKPRIQTSSRRAIRRWRTGGTGPPMAQPSLPPGVRSYSLQFAGHDRVREAVADLGKAGADVYAAEYAPPRRFDFRHLGTTSPISSDDRNWTGSTSGRRRRCNRSLC